MKHGSQIKVSPEVQVSFKSAELPLCLAIKGFQSQVSAARLRLGNEERQNRYWQPDETETCQKCWGKQETLDHLTKNCRLRKRNIWTLLSEKGAGQKCIKTLEAERNAIP